MTRTEHVTEDVALFGAGPGGQEPPVHITFTDSVTMFRYRWLPGQPPRLQVHARRRGVDVLRTVRARAPKGWRRHVRRSKATP